MMKSPKKIHQNVLCIALLITMLLSCVGCDWEIPYGVFGRGEESTTLPTDNDIPSASEDHSTLESPNEGEPPVDENEPTVEFTVTLTKDGSPYSSQTDIYVTWSGKNNTYSAVVDKNGIARINLPDNSYRVTLSSLPTGCAYNPNVHVTTKDQSSITVDLYSVNRLTGSGTDLYYGCYQLSRPGVYSAELESAEDVLYFQYTPQGSGTYTIESWADTTADNINPYIKVYGGSSGYKYYIRDINDGGPEGSYTINFVHTVQMADENIGATGQAVYTFALMADEKNNHYPVTVNFEIKKNEAEDAIFDFSTHNPGKEFSPITDPDAHLYTIVLDVSTNMYRASKFNLAKGAALSLLSSMNDGDYISLITYADGQLYTVYPVEVGNCRCTLADMIDLLPLVEGCDTALGLDQARKIAEGQGCAENQIVLISDGYSFCGTTDPEQTAQKIALTGATLSTIVTYIPSEGTVGSVNMMKLASVGGGQSYSISSSSDIDPIVNTLIPQKES